MTNQSGAIAKIVEARVILLRHAFSRIMPLSQRRALSQTMGGEEGAAIAEIVIRAAKAYDEMPVTYAQDGKGDEAIAYMHYFIGGVDCWVIEKDVSGLPAPGHYDQSFGLQCLTGNIENAELGYVSLIELAEAGAELDLYWEPKTLKQIKQERA